jgi:branched-subunit amino acid ABC-type transport system permease component
MRPFARAPMVTHILVTLGLMLLVSALAQQWFGANDLIVPNNQAIFPRTSAFALGSVKVSWEQVGVIGLAGAFGAILYWFFRYTETGLAIRAAATDRDVASLQGVSVRQLSLISWVGGTMTAGLAGIMLASLVVSSNPGTLVLLSIKGFAAAIVGGMVSFPIAVVAGFVIGIVGEIVRHYSAHANSTIFVGADEIVTLGGVVLVLALRPRWSSRAAPASISPSVGGSIPSRRTACGARRRAGSSPPPRGRGSSARSRSCSAGLPSSSRSSRCPRSGHSR